MIGHDVVRFRDEIADAAHDLYTDLAGIAYNEGKLEAAADFLKKAVDELEASAASPARVASAVNRLGVVYAYGGDYVEAERLVRRAMTLYESFPSGGGEISACACSLAHIYSLMDEPRQALVFAERSLEAAVSACGEESMETAWALDMLGDLHAGLGDHSLSFTQFRRAAAIKRRIAGPEDWEVAVTCSKLAGLFLTQERYNEAEPLLWEAVSIGEASLGLGAPSLARLYSSLSDLYARQRKHSNAELLIRCALAIQVTAYEPSHPAILTNLRRLAEIFHAQGKIAEGEAIWSLAQTILAGAQNQGKVLSFEFRRELRRVSEVGLSRSGDFPARR